MYTIVKKKSGAGCASSFHKLKGQRGRGFKIFGSKEDAVIAHINQSKLSAYNLAPYVYSQVGRVRQSDKSLTGWGFITEIAELICCPGNSCKCCDRTSIMYDYENEVDNLVDNMQDCGFEFGDNHPGNVGFVNRDGNRVMVCIDTGDESVLSPECYCITCRKGGCCHE
jgi:hypothetical protein